MKKPTALLFFFMLCVSIAVIAQDDDDNDSKKYNLGNYDKIYLEGGFKVYLIQDDEYSLSAKSSDNDVFEDLIVRNENGILHVKMDRDFFHYERVTLYFRFKQLEELEIEGGANLKTRGYIDLNDFSMSVEGGAKIEMDIKAKNIDIVGEGGFLFELNGVAENFNVRISGAGNVDAEDLKAQNVDFSVEGFGTGSIYALNKLNAQIEGVGRIRYKGNPKVTQYIDGLGSVKRH